MLAVICLIWVFGVFFLLSLLQAASRSDSSFAPISEPTIAEEDVAAALIELEAQDPNIVDAALNGIERATKEQTTKK